MSDGYVYFVSPERGGPVKVGFSRSPWDRFDELQRKSAPHTTLEMLVFFPATMLVERDLHAQFHAQHITREWFRREGRVAYAIDLLSLLWPLIVEPWDEARL